MNVDKDKVVIRMINTLRNILEHLKKKKKKKFPVMDGGGDVLAGDLFSCGHACMSCPNISPEKGAGRE
jgi:hypothetical protein